MANVIGAQMKKNVSIAISVVDKTIVIMLVTLILYVEVILEMTNYVENAMNIVVWVLVQVIYQNLKVQ